MDATTTKQRAAHYFWLKLTPEKVREIRRRYAAGEVNKTKLARDYGVSQKTIAHIINGKRWAWVKD